ncbi:unnamed protein product [Dicrocoelium dendriticum]|nr:unnamed protein product [Dicrocoelium dendriticum]
MDLSIFTQRALEFRLIDLLMETCSASIAPDDVEVHSAYLLTSKCDSLSSIQPTFKLPSGNAVPHPPAKHHLIIGCRVATFVVKSMQERGAIFVKSVGRFDSASLCLLIVQLYPLNSLGVMWAQDANPSMDYQHVMNESAVNKLTGILADDSPFMQQRSLYVNYSEDAGEMMVKPTTVYTTVSDIQHSDDDANDLFPSVETVQTDRSEPMYEVSNDVSDADSPLIEAAMHEPLSLLAFARVARQHATGFSRALGLDDITFDLMQRHESNKLSQTSLTSCIGSGAAESKKFPTSNTSKFSSELCDAPHLAHSSTLPIGSQTDNFKPKLIELIELPTQSVDMFLDVIQLSLISTTFEPNETENYFAPYSSNILVCCGRSQNFAPVANIYHHPACVGGLYLFG